jgi:hypothetical protein
VSPHKKGGALVAHTSEKILSLLPLLDEQIANYLVTGAPKAPIIEQVWKKLANPGNSDVFIFETETDRLVYDLYFPTEDEIALVWGSHE